MPKGGLRVGSGRKKGGIGRKTIEIANKAVESGITPLEVMIETMRELYNAGDKKAACLIAKDAAPFIHSRLSSIVAENKNSGEMIITWQK